MPPFVGQYFKLALQDPKFSSNDGDDDDDDALYRGNTLIIYVDQVARRLNHENVSVLGMRDPLIPPEEENTLSSRFSRPRKRNYCILHCFKTASSRDNLDARNTRLVPNG